MSTTKERLRAVEVEIQGLRRDFTDFKTFCGKKFDDMADAIENNPGSQLSGKDKAIIVASFITAIGSIIGTIIVIFA